MVETKEKLDIDIQETPELAPAVSVDKEKEYEQDKTELTTDSKLNELQKNISEMLASEDYKKEHGKELLDMKKEIEKNKDNAEFLDKTAEKIEKIKAEQSAQKTKPSFMKKLFYGTLIGSFMANIGRKEGKEWIEEKLNESENKDEKKNGKSKNIFMLAGAFIFGKEAFAKARRFFGFDEEEEEKTEEESKKEESQSEKETPEVSNIEVPTESIGSEIASENTEPPVKPEEKQEIQEAQEVEQKLQKEHGNSLYVLSRMIALGYVPSNLYGWRRANRMINAPWEMKVSLMKLIPALRDKLIREKSYLIANGINSHDYDRDLNRMEAMQQDIKQGKISSMDDLKKNYPDMFENGPMEKLLKNKKLKFEKVSDKVTQKIDTYHEKEAILRDIDAKMKNLEIESQKKYQALHALDEAAANDPVKEKELRKQVEQITKEYNEHSKQLYTETGVAISHLSDAEIVKHQRQFGIVDKLVKANGGVGKFIEKVNVKGGKAMLKIGIAGLVFRGVSDISSQGIISTETALDVTDMGVSLVPIAGGIYDVGMAIRGKDLNGRELSTADRRIRGTVGVGSTVLDFFSFGLGGTALRAGLKATSATVKVVEGAVQTEKAISKGAKISEYIYKGAKLTTGIAMFGGICYGVVVNFVDTAVPIKGGAEYVHETVKAKSTANSESI